MAAGYTFKRIIEAYPQLTKEDILAVLDYAEIFEAGNLTIS